MAGLPITKFYLDDGTGTFPEDVTKFVLLGEGMSFTRGRDDQQSAVTAGTLNATLNNAHPSAPGAFTPGSTVLGSPTLIKLDQRIRCIETIGGSSFTRCTGYAKSWAVGWPGGTDSTSVVKLIAADAQARAERRILEAFIDEEIRADAPATYYKLNDPAGATQAIDTSGNAAPPLRFVGTGTAPVFGAAMNSTLQEYTGVTLAGGQALAPSAASLTPPFPRGYEIVFSRSGTPAAFEGVLWNADFNSPAVAPNFFSWIVWMNASGQLVFGVSNLTTTASYNDGALHHIYLDTTNFKLYVDGVNVLTDVGNQVVSFGAPLSGNIALYAQYPSGAQPSAARIAQHAQAVLTGFAGETGTSRITRLAGYANVPVGSLDTSLTNVPWVDITGQSAWGAIQDVADAEVGIAFIAGDGTLAFHNRFRSPAKATPDLILPASCIVFDAEPTTDDEGMANYLDVTSVSTELTQIVRNTSSETAHGRYPDSKSYLVTTDQEALDRGNWIVATQGEPPAAGRLPSLTINLYGMTPAQAALVLAACEPSCWLRIVSMPSQTTGGTTLDVVVQGIEETQSGDTWQIKCNVVARSLFTAWILGDSVYGVLDSTTKLYV